MEPIQIKLNKFRFRQKLAAFDYTLVLTKNKTNLKDWQWFRPSVPTTLQTLYKKGYCIIICINQSKQTQIENALGTLDIPIMILIGILHIPPNKINLDTSFFCGDALERQNLIGLKVKTLEEVFPLSKEIKKQEIVIMVGYPGSLKTSYASKLAQDDKYIIISGDELKTSKKMITVARPYLKSGKSVIFDATNPSKAKRAEYIEFAKEFKSINIGCIYMSSSMDESMFRNNQRPKEKIVPKIVYYIYRKKFEMPDENEGFSLVII